MLIFFFQEDNSRKFLILLLSYFPVFRLQISSAFAIIFADCHGLSCVHVRASSYTGLFRVSLAGVRLMCVGLVQKISARCNTGSYVFSFLFIGIFILLLALSHIYVFFKHVPSVCVSSHSPRLFFGKLFFTGGRCRFAWRVLTLADENYRGELHEILVKCFKNFVYP